MSPPFNSMLSLSEISIPAFTAGSRFTRILPAIIRARARCRLGARPVLTSRRSRRFFLLFKVSSFYLSILVANLALSSKGWLFKVSGFRCQSSNDRGQTTEDRCQTTEDRCQMSEDRLMVQNPLLCTLSFLFCLLSSVICHPGPSSQALF